MPIFWQLAIDIAQEMDVSPLKEMAPICRSRRKGHFHLSSSPLARAHRSPSLSLSCRLPQGLQDSSYLCQLVSFVSWLQSPRFIELLRVRFVLIPNLSKQQQPTESNFILFNLDCCGLISMATSIYCYLFVVQTPPLSSCPPSLSAKRLADPVSSHLISFRLISSHLVSSRLVSSRLVSSRRLVSPYSLISFHLTSRSSQVN